MTRPRRATLPSRLGPSRYRALLPAYVFSSDTGCNVWRFLVAAPWIQPRLLACFTQMPLPEIREALLAMDVEKLELSHLEAFSKFAPTDEEVGGGGLIAEPIECGEGTEGKAPFS